MQSKIKEKSWKRQQQKGEKEKKEGKGKKSCAFEWCFVIYQSIVGVYGRTVGEFRNVWTK